MQAAFAPVVFTRAVFGPAAPIVAAPTVAAPIAEPMCAVVWAWASVPPPSVRPSRRHTTAARRADIRLIRPATEACAVSGGFWLERKL